MNYNLIPIAFLLSALTAHAQPTLVASGPVRLRQDGGTVRTQHIVLGDSTRWTGSGNSLIRIAGDLQNRGQFNYSPGTVELNGRSLQRIGGPGHTEIGTLVYTANGGVQLTGEVRLRLGLRWVSNGLVVTSDTALLTLIDNAAFLNGANASRFINGPMALELTNRNRTFEFPVGVQDAFYAAYRPLRLSIARERNATGRTVVRFVPGDARADVSPVLSAPLTRISSREYWEVFRPQGSAAIAQVRVSYQQGQTGIENDGPGSGLVVAEYASGTWKSLGGTVNAGSDRITSTQAMTAFHPLVYLAVGSTVPGSLQPDADTATVALHDGTKPALLYPNPAQGATTLLLPEQELAPEMEVQITRLNGQVVRSGTYAMHAGQIELLLEGLPTGIYLVRTPGYSARLVKQ